MPEQRGKPVGVFELVEHIARFMRKMDDGGDYTIRESHAYTGDEWRARGEEYGNKAYLTIVSEGTHWIQLLNGYLGDSGTRAERAEIRRLYEEWDNLIHALGYAWELGYSWSVHFYPEAS